MTREGPAFANGTEWFAWYENWCCNCLVDAPFQRDISKTGCPLIFQAMFEETADGKRVIPDEWLDEERDEKGRYSLGDQYHCINFKPYGWRDPEPRPQPQPQPDGLFDMPARAVRMFLPLHTDPVSQPRPILTLEPL